jgi:ribosomal protein S12 methylthiotransferase accessory factor
MQTESFIPGKDASLEFDREGSAIHGKLLAAYDKLFVPVNKH